MVIDGIIDETVVVIGEKTGILYEIIGTAWCENVDFEETVDKGKDLVWFVDIISDFEDEKGNVTFVFSKVWQFVLSEFKRLLLLIFEFIKLFDKEFSIFLIILSS